MKKCKRFSALAVASLVILLVLTSARLNAQPKSPDFEPQGDDNQYSLGVFRIYVAPPFQTLFDSWALAAGFSPCGTQIDHGGCYGGPNAPNRFTSPLLYDDHTIIGRSGPHMHGPSEPANTMVGSANPVQIGDGDFVDVPAGFQGPDGRREIHTAVAELEMGLLMHPAGIGPPLIRAGHALFSDVSPFAPLELCPGEVESQGVPTHDMPGESFFNVYVEVTIPGLGGIGVDGIVANPLGSPLLIVNNNLDSMPPTVVYIHENSTAVPVKFINGGPGWTSGQLLGYLVLAGHGYDYGPAKSGLAADFLQIMNDHLSTEGEMDLPSGGPVPTLTEWGMIVFCALLFAWMAWVLVRRRKQVA